MAERIDKFDLAEHNVPPEAIAIMFSWKISPPHAKVRLYRTRDDADPQVLAGEGSNGHIGLVETQTLYLGTDETTAITFSITGHETIEGL